MAETPGPGAHQAGQGGVDHSLQAAAARAAADPSDKVALAELFNALYEPVVRFMQARVYEPATAEDLAQEVFVKVVQRISGYTGGGIHAWVFTIARNVTSDHFRRLRNRGYEQPTGEMWQLDMPSDDMGPEEVAQWADLRSAINRKLNKLPEAQQEVLRLRLIAGLSTTETAEVMGKPVGTIRVLQCRALAKLRRLMPDGGSTLATYLLTASDAEQDEALTNVAQVRVREKRHAGSRR
ncbi:sigma-70 family RNA polymerase sigma factor [Streptomyces sp. MC1]|uniref:RNA polymerase sigma factor n=1 Tax=Streptomyces sp. MC1 TaxID=295105 RepID=UPI0018C9C961|nr:sigma-70 family RNA polymerase sigma factor [Streptomyces sp. MC1]MBG7704891.1 sigma-70 family RNA polymerase sigma factor [Streptomyces sp. MC1]